MTSSLSAVFSIKGIQYYKTNNMAQLLWLVDYSKKIFRIFTIIYFFIFLFTAPIIGYLLSGKGISLVFIIFLFLASSANVLFSLGSYRKYVIFYSSINRGYIPIIIKSIITIILFCYLLLTMELFHPEVKEVIFVSQH
jgi:hypothetical protein